MGRMKVEFHYCTVPDTARRPIHVLRISGHVLGPLEIEDFAQRMRDKLASRGEVSPVVVIVHGPIAKDRRFAGDSHAIPRVRDALFNASVSWTEIDPDEFLG
jgi:hypothetical protein